MYTSDKPATPHWHCKMKLTKNSGVLEVVSKLVIEMTRPKIKSFLELAVVIESSGGKN